MSGKEPAASHRGQVLTILSDFFQQAFPPRMDGSFRDPGAFFVTQFFPARTAEQTTERNADFLMEFFPRTDGRTKEQRGHPTFALSGWDYFSLAMSSASEKSLSFCILFLLISKQIGCLQKAHKGLDPLQ